MKKKIIAVAIILVIMIGVTGCSKNNTKLEEIAKSINNCKTVKSYKEYNYDLKASVSKDTLTITTKMNDTNSKVKFELKGDILSNEKLTTKDLTTILLLINGVGITNGYEDGELSQNINSFFEEYKNYTLDKEGLEIIIDENKLSLKIDLSKKIPLIDVNKFYLKADDLDMIQEFIDNKKYGNQNGKMGNIAYNVFVGEEESTIEIGQDEKLSDSAYKSIITALEVMYGEEVAKKFQELYPNFVEEKTTVDAFTIEKDYQPEDKDESVFKDTEIVLVTINNNSLNS